MCLARDSNLTKPEDLCYTLREMEKQKKKKLRQKLTIRQRRFLKNLATSRSLTEAKVKAGYSSLTTTNKIMSTEGVQMFVKKAMNKEDLGIEDLVGYAKEALSAGITKKATNADAIRMIEYLFKLHEAVPQPTQQANPDYSLTLQLKAKSKKELKNMLKALNKDIPHNAIPKDKIIEGKIV